MCFSHVNVLCFCFFSSLSPSLSLFLKINEKGIFE